jgi:hypothetical protein
MVMQALCRDVVTSCDSNVNRRVPEASTGSAREFNGIETIADPARRVPIGRPA